MKRTFIDIRDRDQNCKIIKTYKFRGDVSIIVVSLKSFQVIELENSNKTTTIELEDNHAFSVRNWGN